MTYVVKICCNWVICRSNDHLYSNPLLSMLLSFSLLSSLYYHLYIPLMSVTLSIFLLYLLASMLNLESGMLDCHSF